jgi:diacylglycerol kinase
VSPYLRTFQPLFVFIAIKLIVSIIQITLIIKFELLNVENLVDSIVQQSNSQILQVVKK